MWAALIPEGPLHPEHAAIALIAGVVVGAGVGRRSWAPLAIVGTAAAVFAWRQPGQLVDGIVDRPVPLWAVAGVVGAALVLAALVSVGPHRSGPGTLAVFVGACGAVWATAPDTEAALIGGVVLAAAMPFVRPDAARLLPIAAVVAPMAALVGTVGRPDRLTLVVVALIAAATLWRAVVVGVGWLSARYRAGTPTTVAPGGTSSTTTAPAPTTAS